MAKSSELSSIEFCRAPVLHATPIPAGTNPISHYETTLVVSKPDGASMSFDCPDMEAAENLAIELIRFLEP